MAYDLETSLDVAYFSLDPSSGALALQSAADFENPQDSDQDNTYQVSLSAFDGSQRTSVDLQITITDINDYPVFSPSQLTLSVNENDTSVIHNFLAGDQDNDPLTYVISPHDHDAQYLSVDTTSGAMSFISAADYEDPLDSNLDNQYYFYVSAYDSSGVYDNQDVYLNVVNVNEAPAFTSPSVSLSVAENDLSFVHVVDAAIDPDQGETLSYQLSGTDQSAFNFDPDTLELSFKANPDYELPTDHDGDNFYQVDITASDSDYSTTQAITISVSNSNDEAPQFTSASSQSIEFTTIVVGATIYTVTTSDADSGDQATYTLSGADASHFNLDATSGALAFTQSPSLDSPRDADNNNIYELTITATDQGNNSNQLALSVVVTDAIGKPPAFAELDVSLSVDEGSSGVIYTAAASDPDGDSLVYAISGTDSAQFSIDPSSGALSFVLAPDYEQPADDGGNNIYQLSVSAEDPVGNQGLQSLEISITNLNDNSPQFDLTANSFTIAENTSAVANLAASDADGDPLTFSLVASDDSSLFSLDPDSGALAFISAPDFETAQDSNTDNTYELELSVFDGSHTTTQEITITVTNVNEAPSFPAATLALSVDENNAAVFYTADASDPENDSLTFSISGADQSDFEIDSYDGELQFDHQPDYEAPRNTNNTYYVSVSASDGEYSASVDLTVTVVDVNEAPEYAQGASQSLQADENSAAAIGVDVATDPEQDSLVHSISGDDAGAFSINSVSGNLTYLAPLDYEQPQDFDGDNSYEFSVSASDGQYTTSLDVTLQITDIDDASPQFTSVSSQTVDYTIAQVGAIIYTVSATDPDSDDDQISYALSGIDSSHFSFNTSSGELAFAQAPSLESPQDDNGDNSYELVITATDPVSNSDDLDLSIKVVDDTGSAPTFTQASASINVDENSASTIYTAQATDADSGDTLSYSISGTDSSLFAIEPSSGELAFNTAPDFESPSDNGKDNTYDLAITATDTIGKSANQDLAITILNLNDNPPQFVLSANSFDVAENTTAITTVAANDVDGDDLTFSLTNSTDASFFTLDSSSGVLAFTSAPDFETAQDSNTDNTYELELSVFDGAHTTTQSISVKVTNVDEAPSFTATNQNPSVSENTSGSFYTASASDPEQATLTYSTNGADAGLFDLDSASGELAFKTPPDYESPADQGADNTYQLTITVSDGANQVSQSLAVTVTNVNEAPTFASTSVNLNTDENDLSFTHTVDAADDPDQGEALTYQLGGDDAAEFNFDTATRAISFKATPDFENPADQNTDNTYQITITASDADYSTTQAIIITVADLNDEAPQFTSASSLALDYTAIVVGTNIYTAQATDADANDQVSYTLGGADASQFSFNASSGELAFAQLPSLDSPKDDNGDNSYELVITATDLNANSTDLALSIKVDDDTGSAPTFDQASVSINVDENSPGTIYTAQATDVDPGDTLSYSISGVDVDLFIVGVSNGDIAFIYPPNYETPLDSGAGNTYNLSITATDTIGKEASQSLAITVTDVNEAPAFASTSVNLDSDENDLSFTHTVDAADDPDQGETLSYQLGGDDAADFNFDTATRALSFKQAPDFESPTDQNTDNAYQITITAADADYSTTQAITIAVTNVEESPYFHSTTDHVEITEDPATEGTASPVLALSIQAADDEDDLASTSLNFVISGGADSDKFSLTAVNNNSANLSFKTSPDFDNPHDANLDSNYSLTIEVADSSGDQAQHDVIVQVLGVNDETPQLSSSANADVNENSTAVFYIATATDADRSDWSDPDSSKHYQPNLDSITFSLDTTSYPDSSLFSINSSSGELQATSGLDYENPLSSAQSNYYTVGIEVADQAANSSVNVITVTVIDDPNEPEPVASSGPQIPWFYSDVAVGESIDIPWVIYSGDGAISWSMLVNGTTVCSESASISAPATSGVCSVSSNYLSSGSNLNTAQVSVTYSDSSSESSEQVSFAYAVSATTSRYPTPTASVSDGIAACQNVDIGDEVSATSNVDCWNFLLGNDDFGGPYDEVPSYLTPNYGRGFDVIAYYGDWSIYERGFQPAHMPINLLSTALYSFIMLDGDIPATQAANADEKECEDCSFSGAVDFADYYSAIHKAYSLPDDPLATDKWLGTEGVGDGYVAYGTGIGEHWTDDSAYKGNGIFKQFWLLKQKFPHFKTCISVGGWSFSRPFPLIASDSTKLATFVESITDMAVKYHFDCIDIDWEFPGKAGGDYVNNNSAVVYDYDGDGKTPFITPTAADAGYFVNLISALRAELDSRSEASHIEINSAVYTSEDGMALMDYNAFAGNLDGIHMMTYDYYGAWDAHTGLQAALYANSDPVHSEVSVLHGDVYNDKHNIASAMARAVNNAIDNGFGSNHDIRRKIVPGLAFYGRNYSGVSTTPVPGKYMVLANSAAEQLSWEQGNLNYIQIEGYYEDGATMSGNSAYDAGGYSTAGRSWTYRWDSESMSPFLYDASTGSFIGYTDPRAIFYQTCHAARENSKGVMFWEMTQESADFHLVQAIHTAIRGDTMTQYADQPHCDDIIDRDTTSNNDDGGDTGGGNDDDDDGGDTGGSDTGDTGSETSGLQELEDLGYFTETIFNSLFYNTTLNQGSSTDGACTGYSFFNNWLDLKEAATYYPDFAAEGSMEDRLRELAAFLANTSHETTGAWQTYALDPALGARYHYGYCFKEEVGCENQTSCTQYCDSANTEYGYACSLGTTYHGRGPIQFTWNYNYGAMSEVLYGNNNYTLLENPSILVTDAVISYRSALWFWMTVQAPKPSAHDVMIGNYSAEASKNRYPGFGMTINIINGGLECGTDDFAEAKNKNRLGFYLAYLKVLGDAYDSEISPWVTESSTSTTHGSTPATYSAFDLNEADLISRYTDVETYLSCKNMEHY